MSTEQNKAIVQRYREAHNTNQLDRLDEIVAANLIAHNQMPGLPPGLEGGKMAHMGGVASFPNLQVRTEDLIAEGDKVVVRYTWRGTQQGAFMDIAPTHKQVSISSIDILRFANGKVVEHWGSTDNLGLLQQLGVVPAPGQTS